MAKLTNDLVNSLVADPARDVFVWDDVVRGFGVKVTKGGKKVFVIERRVNGRTCRVTIAQWPRDARTPVSVLRNMAEDLAGKMQAGTDLNAEKRELKSRDPGVNTTVGELCEKYLTEPRAEPLKASSVRNYRWLIHHHFEDWLTKPIVKITDRMVTLRHAEIGQRTSGESANNALRALRAMMNFAVEQKLILSSPVEIMKKKWAKGKVRTGILELSEVGAWINACRDVENDWRTKDREVIGVYLQTVLITGCRKSEALTLRWSDLDFAKGTITFRGTKNGEDRIVPLTCYLMAQLHNLPKPHTGWVFHSSASKSGRIVEPKKTLAAVNAAAGTPDVTLHTLRRSFITHHEGLAETPAGAIKQLVGHSATDVTEKHYARRTMDQLRKYGQRFEDEIVALAGIKSGAPAKRLERAA